MPQEEIQRNINNRFLHIFGAWAAILRIFMVQPFCCCMNRNMHKYAVDKHLFFSTAAKKSHILLKGNIWLISVSCIAQHFGFSYYPARSKDCYELTKSKSDIPLPKVPFLLPVYFKRFSKIYFLSSCLYVMSGPFCF